MAAEADVLDEAEDREPLVERELGGVGRRREADVGGEPADLAVRQRPSQRARDRPATSEARSDEVAVERCALAPNQWVQSLLDAKKRTLDARRRHERRTRHVADDRHVEPGFVQQRELRFEWRAGELLRGLALDDEKRVDRRRMCREKLADEGRRYGVRHI